MGTLKRLRCWLRFFEGFLRVRVQRLRVFVVWCEGFVFALRVRVRCVHFRVRG